MKNTHDVSIFGRKNNLLLERNGTSITLFDWGTEILGQMSSLFSKLDQYHLDFDKYKKQLSDPALTLSGRFLCMKVESGISFSDLGEEIGMNHKNSILNENNDASMMSVFEMEELDAESRLIKKEGMNEESFDDYLRQFLSI